MLIFKNQHQVVYEYLGYMYHCHYMGHHDMNMMGEYFVYKHRDWNGFKRYIW